MKKKIIYKNIDKVDIEYIKKNIDFDKLTDDKLIDVNGKCVLIYVDDYIEFSYVKTIKNIDM